MATATQGVTGRAIPTTTPAVETSSLASMTIADPAPLGLGAFGITTLLLSLVNAGWLGTEADKFAVLAVAIPFGGVAQGLAGMWAFRRGSTFAATAFTAYGAFWISFFLLLEFFIAPVAKAGGAGSANAFVGWYLMAWGIFTAYMLVASLGGARAVQLVFLLLTLTFVFLAFGAWENSDTTTHIGGYLGVLTAAAAIYASFADVLNANMKRRILPT